MISAISNSLAWSAVQVTMLALFVLGLSWVLQKLRISLGSTAPLAGLVGTLIVTAVALVPFQFGGKSAPQETTSNKTSELEVANANIQAAAAQTSQSDPLDWTKALTAGDGEMAAPLPGKSTGMSHGALSRFVAVFGQFRELIRDNANLVLAFIVCGMMIGLVRLWIGLHAVRRFERNSIPIRDRDIRELLDTIRAELSCLAPIELRECGGLRTAATVGVRRPRILLPSEFRDWTHEQRVAVLAHEVAHIVRKDYSNWLVAQFCTIVHYLNPAVQLLANRLRLEQELAADAQAARAAGGRMSYLGVLAEMALTERDLSSGWPARCFLPTHGMFLRRIEMLRTGVSFWSADRAKGRLGIIGLVLAVGVMLAGLRPAPLAMAMSESNVQAGDSPAWASFIPHNAAMVGVYLPQKVSANAEASKIMNALIEIMHPDFESSFGLKVNDVEFAMVAMYPTSDSPAFKEAKVRSGQAPATSPVAIIKSAKPIVSDNLDKMFPKVVSKPGRDDLSAKLAKRWIMLDEKTVAIAMSGDLEFLKGEIQKGPSEDFNKQSKQLRDADGAFLVNGSFFKDMFSNHGGMGNQMLMFAPLWNSAQTLGGQIKLSDKLSFSAFGNYDSEDAAKAAAKTLEAAVIIGKNAIEMHRKQSANGNDHSKMLGMIELAAKALDNVKAATEGTTARVELAVDMKEAGGWSKTFLPHFQEAKKSAGRGVSVNNLKQIALAFHNFHDANGSFPASNAIPANGKAKVSWRVLILPYLDHDALFKEYNMNEEWDGPNNIKLLDRMPKIYQCPGSDSKSNTCYFGVTGEKTIFPNGVGVKLRDITDGTSNTIMVVEAKRDVPWTKPEDIEFDASKDPPELGGFFGDIFNAAFCDGSVRAMNKVKAKAEIKKALTRNGGEVPSN